MTRFSTLHPDGSETDVREIDQSTFLKCPFVIIIPEHYDTTDGAACLCHNPVYRKDVMRAWGYTKKDFKRAKLIK